MSSTKENIKDTIDNGADKAKDATESRRQNEAGYSRRRPKDQECRAETEGFYQISGRPRVRQDCILASVPCDNLE